MTIMVLMDIKSWLISLQAMKRKTERHHLQWWDIILEIQLQRMDTYPEVSVKLITTTSYFLSQKELISKNVKISRCRDMAVIRVQNYTPAPPTLRDGAIVTTKQDTEEHGYGIKSIKSIAELYGGTADCFVEDSIFYLVVTFPCGKSQKETA